MKKLAFVLLILISGSVIYYLTLGPTQLTAELKELVNKELYTLENEGFTIENREIKGSKEHFVLLFNDPEKIKTYLQREHINITLQDINALQGMKIGVDLEYLKGGDSALSFDLYPVALPTSLSGGVLTAEDKESLHRINQLFKAKTFLLHIDINTLFNRFKGSIKDINETFEGERDKVNLVLNSLRFHGEVNDDWITKIDQSLKTLIIKTEKSGKLQLDGFKGIYQLHGPTRYDASYHYRIKTIVLDDLAAKQTIQADQLTVNTNTLLQNELASSRINTTIKTLDIRDNIEHQTLSTLFFDFKVDNLDIKSFEQLQNANTLSKEETDSIVQKILSQGIVMEIFEFSIGEIESNHQKVDGLKMDAKLEIDKSINLSAIQDNPTAGLGALNVTINLNFSNTLFTFIAQKPETLMTMILFQPKEKNGGKQYKIELKNGSLNINGVRMQ